MKEHLQPLINTRSQFRRKTCGVACLDVALASFLMVVMAALGCDITVMVLGMCLNDSACRDAARAAAQQSTSAQAIQAAQAQLQIHGTDGFVVSQPVLASTASPYFVYNDYSGNPPANTSPYVTVTTQVTVKVPSPIFFFGTRFLQNGSLQVSRSYTYPIIKEKFYG